MHVVVHVCACAIKNRQMPCRGDARYCVRFAMRSLLNRNANVSSHAKGCLGRCVRAKGHAQLETKRAGTWRAEGTRDLAAESKALHLQLRKQRYTNMHALNGHGAAAPCRAHMYKYKLI
jgi:hypothetical protein